jgi:putative ABC transport system permease protein
MRMLRQAAAVTAMNLRCLPDRAAASLVVVVGMAAVVAVVTSVLAMSTGFLDTVGKTGRADRAIVMSNGAVSFGSSSLPRDSIPTIMDAPGVRKDGEGGPVGSADIFATMEMLKLSDGLFATATLHGVGPRALALFPQIKLISGRMFKPAVHELIVGRLAQTQFAGFKVGDSLSLPEGDWTIVGSFESDGDQHESELIGDAETIMSAYHRTAFNSVTVMLDSVGAFDGFKASLSGNPALKLQIVRESAFFAKLSKPLNDFLTLVAYVVGGIMGLGAILGALNTMYSAVGARTVEIATLRAVGFGPAPIVASIMAEILLLTLSGAAIGTALAWLAFDGKLAFSDYYVYPLTVGPGLIALGVAIAAMVGLVGGLFPAIRAARLPVATALRAN